jgi:hypothetical protein
MHIDWIGALALAIIVVGVIQYLKLFFPKETNTKVWAVINVVVCFGVSFAIWKAGAGSLVDAIFLGGLALAISQLAYEVIVQGVPSLVQAVLSSIAPPAPPQYPPPRHEEPPVIVQQGMQIPVAMAVDPRGKTP